jgi:hypothetical protein
VNQTPASIQGLLPLADRDLPATYTLHFGPISGRAMLLEDRIRQSFNTALDEASGTLEADLQATLRAQHHADTYDVALAEADQRRGRAADAAETGRAAMLVLKGDWLIGWRCLEALTVQRAVQARASAARVSTPA